MFVGHLKLNEMARLKKVTIDKIEEFSLQEIFDYVVNHLRTQGEVCINLGGLCVYRNAKGQSCAVGCLIPDELYNKEVEEKGASETSFWRALGLGMPEDMERVMLLQDLQFAHDYDKVNWRVQLETVADQYKLNFGGRI